MSISGRVYQPAGRSVTARARARMAIDLIVSNLAAIASVLAGGYGVTYAAWAIAHPHELSAFVLTNQLPEAMRRSLLVLLMAGSTLALALWLIGGALYAARTGRSPGGLLRLTSAAALALAGAAVLPILALPGLPATHPGLAIGLVAGLAALIGIAAWQLANPPQPVALVLAPAPELLAHGYRTGLLVAVVLALAYAIFFAVLTVARHNTFQTHSFDLGIHDQAMYTMLHLGYQRSTQYGVRAINAIGDHFSPSLALLLPVYALKQDARTLLVLQSLLLAAAALPLYLIGRLKTGSVLLALALVASYLLNPALHGVNLADFHQVALAPLPLLLALYWLDIGKGRRATVAALVALVLVLGVKEELALSVAAIGAYLWLARRRYVLGGALAVGGLVYFAVVVGVVMPALGGVPQINRFSGLMAPGSYGFASVAATLLTNPVYTLTFVFGNPQRLVFIAQMLLPLLGLPLLAGAPWLAALPAFSVALLSSTSEQYSLQSQYPAVMLPFLYYLAAVGAARIAARPAARRGLALAMLAGSAAMCWAYSPGLGAQAGGIPQPSAHQQTLAAVLSELPREAPVSTISDLVPHLSTRADIYLFPIVNGAEYILFDSDMRSNYWPFTSRNARAEAVAGLVPHLLTGEYGLVRAVDGVLLLKRGYSVSGNVGALAELYRARFEAEGLRAPSESVVRADPRAAGGQARVAGAGDNRVAVYGPYTSLPAGKHRVHYVLRLEGASSGEQAVTVDVYSVSAGGVLAGRSLGAAELRAGEQYQDFGLDLELSQSLDDLEYRVTHTGPGTLWVDTIETRPLRVMAPLIVHRGQAQPAAGEQVVTTSSLAHLPNERATPAAGTGEPGLLLRRQLPQMLPGPYRVSLTLKRSAEPLPVPPAGQSVARLEVTADPGNALIGWLDVSGQDFAAPGQVHSYTVDMAPTAVQTNVLFRLAGPSAGALALEYFEVSALVEFDDRR